MIAVCMGILLLLPLVDLGIKYVIETRIVEKEEVPIWKGRILLRHVRNEGMALNVLERYPFLVKWMSALTVIPLAVYFVYLLSKKGRQVEKVSLSLVLGGAISNLYDRFVRRYVVDYFGFQSRWERVERITYNLGDMGIFAGTLGMVMAIFFRKNKT